jgi:DNA topoisomerase IB
VHFNPDPNSDLLAVGRDAKGRQQAKYSDAHWAQSAATNFARIDELDRRFDRLMAENEGHRKSANAKTREAADALYLVSKTGIRRGSEKDTGAEKQA